MQACFIDEKVFFSDNFMIVWMGWVGGRLQLGINMTNDRLQTPQVVVEEIVCDENVALGNQNLATLSLGLLLFLCVLCGKTSLKVCFLSLFLCSLPSHVH